MTSNQEARFRAINEPRSTRIPSPLVEMAVLDDDELEARLRIAAEAILRSSGRNGLKSSITETRSRLIRTRGLIPRKSQYERDEEEAGLSERDIDRLLDRLESLHRAISAKYEGWPEEEVADTKEARDADEIDFQLSLLVGRPAATRLADEARVLGSKAGIFADVLERHELGIDGLERHGGGASVRTAGAQTAGSPPPNKGGGSKPKTVYVALLNHILDGPIKLEERMSTVIGVINTPADLQRATDDFLDSCDDRNEIDGKRVAKFEFVKYKFDFEVTGTSETVYKTVKRQLVAQGRITPDSPFGDFKDGVKNYSSMLADQGGFYPPKDYKVGE